MNRWLFSLILFFGGIIYIIACGKRSIEIKNYSDSGQLIEHYYINIDSLKQGKYISFDQQGNIFEESHYEDGELSGLRYIYFPNGGIEIQENYKDDVLDGLYRSFYDNGQVNVEAQYHKGVMEGLVKKYYYSGELMEEVSFKDNEENGPFKEYFKNGNVKWEGNYINGDNEIGIINGYNEQGELIKKMECGKYKGEYICQTIWSLEEGAKELQFEYDQ